MNANAAASAVDIGTAVTYSFIAFSIVFIVLGGLTLVIYAMRLLTGSNGGGDSASKEKTINTAKPEPAAAAPVSGAAANVKSQHIAAVTAAILAVTGGARILSVTPGGAAALSIETTRSRWRSAGIVEASSRGIPPAWKR